MSKAPRKTKRLKKMAAAWKSPTATVIDFLYRRLMSPDLRSQAQFLRDMRSRQRAGLTNPTTDSLLDRLERAIR